MDSIELGEPVDERDISDDYQALMEAVQNLRLVGGDASGCNVWISYKSWAKLQAVLRDQQGWDR